MGAGLLFAVFPIDIRKIVAIVTNRAGGAWYDGLEKKARE